MFKEASDADNIMHACIPIYPYGIFSFVSVPTGGLGNTRADFAIFPGFFGPRGPAAFAEGAGDQGARRHSPGAKGPG